MNQAYPGPVLSELHGESCEIVQLSTFDSSRFFLLCLLAQEIPRLFSSYGVGLNQDSIVSKKEDLKLPLGERR